MRTRLMIEEPPYGYEHVMRSRDGMLFVDIRLRFHPAYKRVRQIRPIFGVHPGIRRFYGPEERK